MSINLSSTWKVIERRIDGAAYIRNDGLKVISSVEQIDDDIWQHVSMSRKSRVPSYVDMVAVKHLFMGDEVHAYQVFPPKKEHVNIHTYCLHLFGLVNGERALPDFTHGSGSI